MIDILRINNFTTMANCELDLSAKLNVIIGTNGAGKTHLLKVAYVLAFAKSKLLSSKVGSSDELRKSIGKKLVSVFKPCDGKLGHLHRSGADEPAVIEATFADGEKITLRFSSRSTYPEILREATKPTKLGTPIFLPTKELLSLLEGMQHRDADRETLDRVFDGTYMDLAELLSMPALDGIDVRIERDPRFGTLYPATVNAITGVFSIDDGRMQFAAGRYDEKPSKSQHKFGILFEPKFIRTNDRAISSHMTAEGYRKIGMIQHLLANGSMDLDLGGTLLWDEPETNMNPMLVKQVVKAILELTRNNFQAVLATHDYVFLKWIDLLEVSELGDHVRFHSLHRSNDLEGASVSSTDIFSELLPNAIDEAYGELTDAEISQSMGELGKK